MAAYDSWNPGSAAEAGDSSNCMNNAAMSVSDMSVDRPVNLAVSPISTNRNALVIDGPAPVA